MCKCFGPRRTFGTFCCCLPLALIALLTSIFFIGWGGYDIWLITHQENFFQWQDAISLILSGIRVLAGICGLIAVLFKWPAGAMMLVAVYKLILAAAVMTFLIAWIAWITIIYEKKHPKDDTPQSTLDFPSSEELTAIIIFNVLYVIFFAASWWLCSCFASLAAILAAGGSGWENKSAKEIKQEKAAGGPHARQVGSDDEV